MVNLELLEVDLGSIHEGVPGAAPVLCGKHTISGHSNPGNCASNFLEKISHCFVTFTSALL